MMGSGFSRFPTKARARPYDKQGSCFQGDHMSVVEKPISPAGLPLAGTMSDLKRDALGTLVRAQREHGDVVRFATAIPGLRAEVYCAFSADGVQQVLASDSANFRKDNA